MSASNQLQLQSPPVLLASLRLCVCACTRLPLSFPGPLLSGPIIIIASLSPLLLLLLLLLPPSRSHLIPSILTSTHANIPLSSLSPSASASTPDSSFRPFLFHRSRRHRHHSRRRSPCFYLEHFRRISFKFLLKHHTHTQRAHSQADSQDDA